MTAQIPFPHRSPSPDDLPGIRGIVRVRTLLYLRWLALAGQMIGLHVVLNILRLPLPLAECIGVILAGLLANLILLAARKPRAWVGERMATLNVAFDMLQFSALLFLTGGMQNPFAIVLLAPVTISATVLPLRSTVLLGLLAIGLVTLLSLVHYPLPWPNDWDESGLNLPRLYLGGVWVALVTAIVFIATHTWRVAAEARNMAAAFTATRIALEREQKASAVGALAAAAAHELGSPLSTIAVVSKELARDVPRDSELRADIDLLLSESARCRDILARLTESPESQSPAEVIESPSVTALVTAIVEPYEGPRIPIQILVDEASEGVEPRMLRQSELVHGLGNFIQNAAQFARERVTLTLRWDEEDIVLTVADDGPGYPSQVLDRLGEPYISTRPDEDGHMGLGVFIATTLLAHTGAQVRFANGDAGGAQVTILWDRRRVEDDITRATKPGFLVSAGLEGGE